MIAEEKIREAETMLARRTMSQRKIAETTGLSRGTISMIANGTRTIQVKVIDPDMPPEQVNGPKVRCPGCGGMVQMPCLLCYLKSLSGNNSPIMQPCPNIVQSSPAMTNAQHSTKATIRLGLHLTDDEFKRYREVRTWREKCSNPFFTDIPEDWPWRKS